MHFFIKQGDFLLLSREAHKMSGGAANLTAQALASTAKALELNNQAELADSAEQQLDSLFGEVQRLQHFFSGDREQWTA